MLSYSYIQAACKYSAYLRNLIQNDRLDTDFLSQIIEARLPSDFFSNFANWTEFIDQLDEMNLKKELRHLRCIVFIHLLIRDLAHLATLDEVMETMSDLAEFTLLQAQKWVERYYSLRYGCPIGEESLRHQHLSIIAMGKLGGRELNVSSDIDLIFTFPEEGATDGLRSISQQEFFTKVAQKLIRIIDEVTEDGRVFRVDMRLRPYGDSGPIVLSETALENYLLTQGREWERYAWLKARVISPYPNHVDQLVCPFVYRKYLDYYSLEAMKKLHHRIKQDISLSVAIENIKLGFGGIREVEFIAQIFQLIRGGNLAELQLRGTQAALKGIKDLHLLSREHSDKLLEAYRFLRHVEHRLQYRNDQQTQLLPSQPVEQNLLAESMGFADYASFLKVLSAYREEVNTLFESIFHETDVKSKISQASLNFAWENPTRTFKTLQRLERYGCVEPGDILFQLQEFKENISYDKLDTRIQTSFDQLVPHYLEVIFELGLGKLALGRILEFSKSIMERPSYLIFLNEYPMVIRQLIVLLSKSQWLANYLTKYPMLLDELISEQLWDRNFDWSHLKKQLDEQLEELSDDVEQQMDRLRKFQHGFFFRLAVQELEGLWTVEALSDQLAALADAILEVALKQVWRNYRKAHKEVPQFAIIAYGKLGGKELTYTSDLDLVYLYSDNYPEAIDIYSWFSSRLTLFLSAATGSGRLYEVDLRLRPYGEVGFLATDFDLFQNYQYEKAWTWEHQALTRARFVCGSRHLKIKFEQLRKKILVSHRDPAQLKQQIIEMRNKMLNSHPSRDLLDVKHTRGGLADVEFIIQYIVLAYSARYPDLTENVGNIALLQRSAQYGIIEESLAEKVRWAYRHYRKIAHNQILHDIPPQIDLEALKIDYNYVKTLWHKVLET